MNMFSADALSVHDRHAAVNKLLLADMTFACVDIFCEKSSQQPALRQNAEQSAVKQLSLSLPSKSQHRSFIHSCVTLISFHRVSLHTALNESV